MTTNIDIAAIETRNIFRSLLRALRWIEEVEDVPDGTGTKIEAFYSAAQMIGQAKQSATVADFHGARGIYEMVVRFDMMIRCKYIYRIC